MLALIEKDQSRRNAALNPNQGQPYGLQLTTGIKVYYLFFVLMPSFLFCVCAAVCRWADLMHNANIFLFVNASLCVFCV
jgi:hypothetical protein